MQDSHDLVVLGAGAAGLMAALAARGAVDERGRPSPPAPGAPKVLLLDASARPGLKILLSGGGRCNVTNEVVTAADFESDAPHLVRGLLKGFPAASVATFFAASGCALYAEPLGKLFPATDRARDVLDTLLAAARAAGVELRAQHQVTAVERDGAGFRIRCAHGAEVRARRVLVATGGRSLPKTGSRGFGYELARSLGHAVVPELPALTPVWLAPDGPLAGLAGLTVPALLTLAPAGTTPEQAAGRNFRPLARAAGSLLITHRGISGPAALDVSGACGRALLERQRVALFADFWTLLREHSPFAPYLDAPKLPGASLRADDTPRPVPLEDFMHDAPRMLNDWRRSLLVALGDVLPRSLAERLLRAAGLLPHRRALEATPLDWKRLHAACAHLDVGLSGTDDWSKAEVTAGGVPLGELDRRTLESRVAPGIHFCGEVVHVTGRLGGFNFQWAWSSGFAAGRGAAGAMGAAG